MGGKSRDLDLYIIYKIYRNTKEMDGWLSSNWRGKQHLSLNPVQPSSRVSQFWTHSTPSTESSRKKCAKQALNVERR